jgi:DNA helicase HerA-like ATPase
LRSDAARIWIKGASGSGKSTLSRELARHLELPHVELDSLHHGPHWAAASAEELQARVLDALDDERGWNGNRESLKGAFWGGEALFPWAVRTHFRYRRQWPRLLAARSVVRLRTRGEVDAWLRHPRRLGPRPLLQFAAAASTAASLAAKYSSPARVRTTK